MMDVNKIWVETINDKHLKEQGTKILFIEIYS